MRAPTISPKKCSVVKVDRCEEDVERDRQQTPSRQASDEMDTSENIVLGAERIGVTQTRETMEVHDTVEGISLEGGKGNFDDTLKEIDSALNVFYETNTVSPRLKEVCLDAVHSSGTITGMGAGVEAIGALVQEDHRAIIDVENNTSSSGSFKGWKRLARDKNGVVQSGSSSGGKISVDDCLEGVADLVPTKRRCASVKSNEMVETDAQPRRAQ